MKRARPAHARLSRWPRSRARNGSPASLHGGPAAISRPVATPNSSVSTIGSTKGFSCEQGRAERHPSRFVGRANGTSEYALARPAGALVRHCHSSGNGARRGKAGRLVVREVDKMSLAWRRRMSERASERGANILRRPIDGRRQTASINRAPIWRRRREWRLARLKQ